MDTPLRQQAIGVIDSGMGGITVWAELVRSMPRESIVYWADSANCPYGGRSNAEIVSLTRAGVVELIGRGVKAIVIACNTATTAAIGTLRAEFTDIPFIGLEPAIKPAAERTRSGVIGVLATQATLASDMFAQTKARYGAGVQVIETVGRGLVELAEAGAEESPEAYDRVEELLAPMLAAGADFLVLACTHYPLFHKAIETIVAGRMEVIDPAGAVARHTLNTLAKEGLLAEEDAVADYQFLSTAGPDHALELAERAKKYTFTR